MAKKAPPVGGWVQFPRSDAGVVIDLVRVVAARLDPGEHGHGVEIVIETPRPGRRVWPFPARRPGQARLVVTKPGGVVGYPFDIQLITQYDGGAARRVGARPGWAISNTAGMAFLIQKGRAGDRYQFGSLVGAAVAALTELCPKAGDRGWRARIDRSVSRV